jgi:endonuclease/exonuclease/phosphatase family metal-dependent hydrolase
MTQPAPPHGTHHLRIVTYNVHRCQGLDRRTRPDRIADVLRDLNADVIALQEVLGATPSSEGQVAQIGAALGMGSVMAPTRTYRGVPFGNAVLSRRPIRAHTQHDLSWQHREPRTAQRVDIDLGDGLLHLFNVHFGTALMERQVQATALVDLVLDPHLTGVRIVLGDFNEWARGLATDILASHLHSLDVSAHLPRRRTYPAVLPVLHLDHLYYEGRVSVDHVLIPRDRTALLASDHLPLAVDLQIRC